MKKLNGLDIYVIFALSTLLIYSIVEFIVSSIIGWEHTALTAMLGGVLGGEVLSCALIKIFKLREEDPECDWREKE